MFIICIPDWREMTINIKILTEKLIIKFHLVFVSNWFFTFLTSRFDLLLI